MRCVLLNANNARKALDSLCEGYPVTLHGEGRQVVLSTSGNAGDYRFVADIGLRHGGHREASWSRFDLLVDFFSQPWYADLQSISF